VRGAALNLAQDASENTERTADTIAAQTRSQQVRVNAIQWKLVSSVELETAALARDPVVALGDIELTARLLDVRVQQIQHDLLKQARWQAELLLADVASQPMVDSLMGQVGRLNASVERITVVVEGAPELIDSQRIAVVEALHDERVATLKDAEASAQRLIDYTLNQRIQLLIDRVLWRLFFGVVLLILIAFVAGLILLSVARRNVRVVRA
jgi:hypothetical protein